MGGEAFIGAWLALMAFFALGCLFSLSYRLWEILETKGQALQGQPTWFWTKQALKAAVIVATILQIAYFIG